MYIKEELEKDLEVICNYTNKDKWAHFGAKTKGTYLNRIKAKYPDRPIGTHLKVYLEILLGKFVSKEERKAELSKAYFREYYLKNREDKLEYQKEYSRRNKEKIINYREIYKLYNITAIRARNRLYKRNNRGLVNADCAKRRASKILRTPKWADLNKIKDFYINCPNGYHVDHIYPLNGELV